MTEKDAIPENIPVYSSSGISYFHNQAKTKGPGVVTGRKGSIGQVHFVETDFWPHDTTLWVKNFKGNSPKYVKYFLEFLNLERYDEASSVPTLNRNNIHDIKCIFPPLEEQKQIVKIFKVWEDAIDRTNLLITAKLERRSWLMNQLLTGNRRLPGFIKRWKKVQIGDVLQEIARPVEMHDNELYELASVRRNWGGLFVRERLYGHNIKTKNLHEIKENDFLISHIQAAYGSLSLVPKEYDGFKVSDLYTCLVPRNIDELNIRFFSYLAQQPKMTYLARISSNGFFAERLRLNFKIESFINQEIRIPPTIQEQQAIVHVLETADRGIDLLRTQLDALRDQKRGLMQQILTGRIRVSV